MTPRQILAVLAARWYWVAVALCLVLAATLGISTTLLKRYTATATVMLDARTPDQVAGGAPSSSLPGGYMATQMELASSERVARGVIKSLKLKEDPHWQEAWQKVSAGSAGDFDAWLAEALSKSLSVRPSPISNVLSFTFTSDDPVDAARMANAYVKAYVDSSLQMRTERARQFGGFFDARAQELKAELEQAQARLSEYQQKNGLIVSDDKSDFEATRLAQLNAQLVAAQAANAEVAARFRRASQEDQFADSARNPAVAQLESDVTREEVRLRELRARLGDSHPQLIEQEARLAELKTRLAAERGRTASYVGVDNSVSSSRVAQLAAAVEAQRAKVLRVQGHREQMNALQRDVDNAQKAYAEMQQRLTATSVESQNMHTNVTVLKEATAPISPSSPNMLKNAGAAVAGGLLLGIGLVLGREQLDRRLRTVDDVADLKQAMLVTLPVAAHANRAAPDTRRAQLMKQRVLTGLPRPTQQSS